MMTRTFLKQLTAISIFLAISGCSTNRYRNYVKVGKWIEKDKVDTVVYKRVEFYKKGKEKGTWKHYAGKVLLSREKYKRDTCYTKFYYPNRVVSSSGKSIKIREKDGALHWFYIGEWRYYDTSGKLELIRIYKNGLEVEEFLVSPKNSISGKY